MKNLFKQRTKRILLFAVACVTIMFALASYFFVIPKKNISTEEKEQNSVAKEGIQTSPIASRILSSRFGKIPVWISTSENIYSEPTTLLNFGSGYYPIRSIAPELSRGKTVSVEGAYYVYRDSPRVDWAWNGNKSASSRICLNKKLDIPDGAVIQAKMFIFPTPQEYCETGEIKEYKILYTEPSLAELSKKFSPICDDLASFLAEEHKENPLKLYTCFGDVPSAGRFGEKFTHSDFEWLPFEGKMVVGIWAVSEKTTEENKEKICKLERKGAIVLNLASEKVEEIYMTQAEEMCKIID